MNAEPTSRFANFCPDNKDELILAALEDSDGLMVRDVAAQTGLKEITIRYHLATMEVAKWVWSEKRRKYIFYHPVERSSSG